LLRRALSLLDYLRSIAFWAASALDNDAIAATAATTIASTIAAAGIASTVIIGFLLGTTIVDVLFLCRLILVVIVLFH
jgi:hypothetical protein